MASGGERPRFVFFNFCSKIYDVKLQSSHNKRNGVGIIRRIKLNMTEEKKYKVIKDLVDHNGNKQRATMTLNCTKRTIDRYISGYKKDGRAFFIHGNKGRQPSHTIDEKIKKKIVKLYETKYPNANIAHFAELLGRNEQIYVSESFVRKLLASKDILSPKANRKTRRLLNKRLNDQLEKAKTPKEKATIVSKIITADNAHQRRPRCMYFGEMIQMDATLHLWFGTVKCTLHIAVDDASGLIVGAWFEPQETLVGYYNVFKQILTSYGIPYMFYTDKRTVFEYKKSGSQDVADDSFTQFSYACSQLGVVLKTTSVPQAKGRIERLIASMQSRLPVELELEGVTTIEQANEFLPKFIKQYNSKFALPLDNITSVFETPPTPEKTNLILAVLTDRVVDTGHTLRFENKYYRPLNSYSSPVFFTKGVKGLVIRAFDGSLFFSCDDGIYALEEIPTHERISKNFDPKPEDTAKPKIYIPKPNHPWRLAAFVAFNKKNLHNQVST